MRGRSLAISESPIAISSIYVSESVIARCGLWVVVLLVSILQAESILAYGLFEDSLYYFQRFLQVGNEGYIGTIIQIYNDHGKFEPALFYVFYLQNILGIESERGFLISNTFLMNIVLVLSMAKVIGFEPSKKIWMICAALLSYFIVSKNMYFYRSVWAFSFMMLAYGSERKKARFVNSIIAMLFHSSTLFLLPFLFFCKFVASRKVAAISLIGFSIVSGLSVVWLLKLFSPIVANNDVSVFTGEATHAYNIALTILYGMTVLLFVSTSAFSSLSLRKKGLILFVICLSLFSIINFNNYFAMSRAYLPAALIIPFLPFFRSTPLPWPYISISSALLIMSVLPSCRLFFKLLIGNLHAAS